MCILLNAIIQANQKISLDHSPKFSFKNKTLQIQVIDKLVKQNFCN